MTNALQASKNFTLAYYSGDRKTGSVVVAEFSGGKPSVTKIETGPDSGLEKLLKPVFIGMTEDHQIILLDPQKKALQIQASFPADAFPAHIYSDPYSSRDFFMNDGDKETGNDTLNCGDKGSSVTVVENTSSSQAKLLDIICVGRGHHQAAFSAPSESAPNVPRRAFISNLKDGTISVLGNDPEDADTYLKLITTINLCEPDKEDAGEETIPNNAFPHGLAYSPLTGRFYNLNNGYGTVAIIDPVNNTIEERIPFKGHSNLFMTPGGRYIIGRGADRKSDGEHVIGKLSILDVTTNTITDKADLQDIYISKYYFNKEGSKLYLTTGTSGSPEQQANIKKDALLVFDMTALPKIKLIKELNIGSSGSLDFLEENGKTSCVFSSNTEEGSVVVFDGVDESILDNIKVTEGKTHSRLWLLNS